MNNSFIYHFSLLNFLWLFVLHALMTKIDFFWFFKQFYVINIFIMDGLV